MSDIPTPLTFVDPTETSSLFRTVLWAAPGAGKSVAAASAPAPLVVISADRPGAYRFARIHHKGKDIREVRFQGVQTFSQVWTYLTSPEGKDVKTLVVDPFTGIYDKIVEQAPKQKDGDPQWQWVNKTVLDFFKALNDLPIHVVIVAHERLNDGKNGDGKLYPALGGPALISKILAEVDICAHVESHQEGDGPRVWGAQLQPLPHMVAKDSTDSLGERRFADLTEWFQTAASRLAPAQEDDSDLPFTAKPETTDVVDQGELLDADEAAA